MATLQSLSGMGSLRVRFRVLNRVPVLRRSAWRCCNLFQGSEQGPSAAQERVATLQSLSGTGSLRVGAEFISKFLPGRTVYLSNPTWCALAVLPGGCSSNQGTYQD